MLVIDERWRGKHGIARFGAEVLARLDLEHSVLGGPSEPLSPLDAVNPARLKLGRGDVVYSPGFNAGLTRARQVLTVHDLIHLAEKNESTISKRAYYSALVRPAIRRCGLVFTVSTQSAVALHEWLGEDGVRVENVGNGCADVFFGELPAHRDPSAVVLYVGNLKPHKNPEVVFAAVARLPRVRLAVVTSDTEKAREFARRFGVSDRVELIVGPSDLELRAHYLRSSALILPSLLEGFGLPAVEALASGRPVAHWRGCGSVADIVGEHGLAVERADDVEAWAEAIDHLVTTDDGTPHRPAGWRERYSWDAVAARVQSNLIDIA